MALALSQRLYGSANMLFRLTAVLLAMLMHRDSARHVKRTRLCSDCCCVLIAAFLAACVLRFCPFPELYAAATHAICASVVFAKCAICQLVCTLCLALCIGIPTALVLYSGHMKLKLSLKRDILRPWHPSPPYTPLSTPCNSLILTSLDLSQLGALSQTPGSSIISASTPRHLQPAPLPLRNDISHLDPSPGHHGLHSSPSDNSHDKPRAAYRTQDSAREACISSTTKQSCVEPLEAGKDAGDQGMTCTPAGNPTSQHHIGNPGPSLGRGPKRGDTARWPSFYFKKAEAAHVPGSERKRRGWASKLMCMQVEVDM